jgi:two-component system, OmpR family, response regulator
MVGQYPAAIKLLFRRIKSILIAASSREGCNASSSRQPNDQSGGECQWTAAVLDMSQFVAEPPRAMSKLLLIEDDDETAVEVVGELAHRGYMVERAATGTAGIELARVGDYDVLIVDRLLPEVDGLTIIERLRRENKRTPVLVLSALGALDDRVRGLRAGGDDYLAKPFALVELIARVEALLRRPAVGRETRLRVGPLELDLIERTVTRSGRKIELLPREFRLLEYMMRRPDQMVTRAMLFEDVWNYRFVPDSNLVDVHMGKLRHKIDAPGDEPVIQNVRGAGFILRANA